MNNQKKNHLDVQEIEHQEKVISTMLIVCQQFKLFAPYVVELDSTELLSFKEPVLMYKYILYHKEWNREWSKFLLHFLTDIIYDDIQIN